MMISISLPLRSCYYSVFKHFIVIMWIILHHHHHHHHNHSHQHHRYIVVIVQVFSCYQITIPSNFRSNFSISIRADWPLNIAVLLPLLPGPLPIPPLPIWWWWWWWSLSTEEELEGNNMMNKVISSK